MMPTSLANIVGCRCFPKGVSPNTLHTVTPEEGAMVCTHSTYNSVPLQVELNECVQCEFSFINTGKFNFSFQAELSGPRSLLQYLEFSPIDGSVDVGQSAHASLSFQPLKKCVLKGLELKIKVRHLTLSNTERAHSILSWELCPMSTLSCKAGWEVKHVSQASWQSIRVLLMRKPQEADVGWELTGLCTPLCLQAEVFLQWFKSQCGA